MSSTYAVGPVVGPHLAAGPEAGALPVREPQHQVGEAEVGDDLPVRLQQLEPGDVVVVEVRVVTDELDQGRHAGQRRRRAMALTGEAHPAPPRQTALRRETRHPLAGWSSCRGSTGSRCRFRTGRPSGPAAGRPHRRADPHARRHRSRGARRHRLPTLATWVGRGVYDDLLSGLGDGMAAGLGVGLGEKDTDSVFRRSFSALILGECIARDNKRPLVPGSKVLEWGDRVATWLLRERDLRGFVPGKGWAHAVAHGADALGTLAQSPHVAANELTVILDVIADRVLLPVDRLFTNGEPDRLAAATMEVLRRNIVSLRVIEPWIARLVGHRRLARVVRRPRPAPQGRQRRGLPARAAPAARARPEPPEVRPDLLLVLVDALRATNPHYLQAAQPQLIAVLQEWPHDRFHRGPQRAARRRRRARARRRDHVHAVGGARLPDVRRRRAGRPADAAPRRPARADRGVRRRGHRQADQGPRAGGAHRRAGRDQRRQRHRAGTVRRVTDGRGRRPRAAEPLGQRQPPGARPAAHRRVGVQAGPHHPDRRRHPLRHGRGVPRRPQPAPRAGVRRRTDGRVLQLRLGPGAAAARAAADRAGRATR